MGRHTALVVCVAVVSQLWSTSFLCTCQATQTRNVSTEPLMVEILDGAREVTTIPGNRVRLTCRVNRDLSFALRYQLRWVESRPSDLGAPLDQRVWTETELAVQGSLRDAARPDNYGVQINYSAEEFTSTLILKEVRERDEGRYLCRVTTSDGRIIMQDHVDLFVHFSVEEVSISLDGNQLLFLPRDITSTAGDHVMTCTVSSLAPGISMVVTHGNESMTLAPNVTGTADMEAGDGGQTLYRATLTAHVTFADRGPLYNWGWLGCEATPRGITGAVTFRKAVEVYVEGTRVVSCIPTVHSVGDLYVQLLCFVTFSHINTDISQYYWVYASTGQVIYPGQTNALHDEAFDVKVLNSTTALLRLELYELLPLHVSPGIYLMTSTLDGRLFLEKVPLTLRHV